MERVFFKPEDDELCSAEIALLSGLQSIKSDSFYTDYDPAGACYITINGCKWDDTDGNGEWDEGENGIPNWKILVAPKSIQNQKETHGNTMFPQDTSVAITLVMMTTISKIHGVHMNSPPMKMVATKLPLKRRLPRYRRKT